VDYSKKSKEELIKEINFLKNKVEEKLIISEKSFKDLFDKSPDLLYIQSKEGEFIDINKTALIKYGYKKEDILGKTPAHFSAPGKNNIEIIKKKIELAWKGKKQIFEFWAETKKGVVFPKEVIIRKCTYFGKEALLATARDITKQKIAENHLKENEEKYRNVFTKNLAGVFITENEKIVDCNNSFAKIFGYKSRVELIGKDVSDLYFSKKDRNEYVKKLKRKGYLTNHQIRHTNKKGEEIWISTNVVLKENGRIEGTLVGITEQVKAERKLKESRGNYKKLIDNSPYGTIIHIDGEILYANPEALGLFGLKSLNEIKEKTNIFHFLPKEFHKEGLERRKKIIKGEEVPFNEVYIKHPYTGKTIILETKASGYDYKGKKAIQLFIKDITTEKELSKEKLRATIAEESNKILQNEILERKKIEKRLIENQKYTSSIINSSIDIICASDKSGKIIEFNKAAEYAFGYKEKEIINKEVKLIYSSKKDFIEVSRQLKKNGIFVGEIENQRKNGEIFTSFLSASVLHNENGEHIGTMGVSRDITELKEAEKQLIESEEKQKNQIIIKEITSSLLALSHENLSINETMEKAINILLKLPFSKLLPRAGIFIAKNDKLELVAHKNFTEGLIKTCGDKPVPFGTCLCGRAAESKKVVFASCIDDRHDTLPEGTEPHGHYNVPIVVNNEVLGVIVFYLPDGYKKSNEEIEILKSVATTLGLTIKKIKAEQYLVESLQEKDVLLKEVHHRVKNNLQVISSILNLQSSYVKEENTLNILRESQNRIKSMAFIHESLYQTTDFSKINFSEYITSLSKNLVHSYGAYDSLVGLKLKVGDISLNLDLSIPCGLIINELVSNSLKYAFADKRKGEIKIELFEKK